MSKRFNFLDYIKNGGNKPFVSLQIGGGAGFDTKLAGKKWITETTIMDTIRAYETVGCEPLINIPLCEFDKFIPELKRQTITQENIDKKSSESSLESPFGQLYWKMNEIPKEGIVPLVYPVNSNDPAAFDKICWYAEQFHKAGKYIQELMGPEIFMIHEQDAPVCIQWNLQPFEMLGLTTVDQLVMLAMLEPEKFRKTCDIVRDVNLDILEQVIKTGADFVFLGGPGSEMLSPKLYQDFLIPDSKIITDSVHRLGGLIYSHICSPVEPFLSMGFYNQMGIDLFETLSPPPVGNVTDLAKARKTDLVANICTRGNIGLDVLLNGTVEDVQRAVEEIWQATKGSKHMIAASDYLFYDIPLENVKAVVDMAEKLSFNS